MLRRIAIAILGLMLALSGTLWAISYLDMRLFVSPYRVVHFCEGAALYTRTFANRDIAVLRQAWVGNPTPWSRGLAMQLESAGMTVSVWKWPHVLWCRARFQGWTTQWKLNWQRRPMGLLRVVVPLWLPTAVLLAALWMVWNPLAVRRRRYRAGRGLCPACGYDLRGSPHSCPECGVPRVEGRGL